MPLDPNRSQQPESPANGRKYDVPEVKVMDEKEILKLFQITSAGVSWWF